MTRGRRILVGVGSLTLMTASALVGQTLPAVAQAETVKVTGKWQIIPSAAGTYRLTVACPAHTRPEGGSVSFRAERDYGKSKPDRPLRGFVSLTEDMWPRRVVGGSLGHSSGNVLYAEFVLERGPRLKARVTARCRVRSTSA